MTFSRNILALLVLGWVLLSAWLEWQQYQNQIQSLVLEKTSTGQNAANDLAHRLEKTLAIYHSLPLLLAQDPLVLAVLTGNDCPVSDQVPHPASAVTHAPSTAALQNLNLLLHRVQSTLGPDLIWVMDTNGLCLAASNSDQTNSLVGDHFIHREYFRQARDSGQGQQYAMGQRIRKPGLYFAAGVRQSGRFLGEAAIKLNMDHLDDCLDLPDTFLADENGVVILANNPALLMQALPSAPVNQLSEPDRQYHYRLDHFSTLSLAPWSNTNAAPFLLFNHEVPPQLLFSQEVSGENLRVYVLEPLPALLTLPQDHLAYFTLLALAGGSLILLLGASYNYSHHQLLTNRRLRSQTELLMDAERIARLGSWNCELPSGQLQLSEQAAEIFQLPSRQTTGSSARFAALAVPADRDRVNRAIERAIHSGTPCDLEYQLARPDGRQTIIHLQGRLVTGPRRQPVRLVGTVQDITARQQVEQAVRHSVSLLKATLESTTDGILVVDRAGNITSYNERFLKLWQVPRDIIALGQDEFVLKHALGQLQNPGAFLAKVQELYQNPEAESFDLLKFADGRIFERISKPQVIAGQPVGRVWSFYDVTERQRAENSALEMERRLRTVIEATMDVIFLKDALGRWQLINHAARRLFSLTEIDYQGKTGLELTALVPEHQAELASCARTDQQAWEQRQPIRSEEFIRHEDGLVHCFDVIKVPIFNDDGSRHSLVVVGRDITERKQTEQELFKSREALMMILNNIPQRVYWKNSDLIFEGCNLPFARDCGLADPSQIIGKTDFDLTNADDAEQYRTMDREVMALNQPKLNFERTEIRTNGTLAYLLVSKLPLHDQAGRVTGVLGTFDDITGRKLLEDEFRQAQKMEAIGRLAGGVAHDFNNLLTVICGYSEILLHELPPGDSSRESLTEIRKAGDRAASLTRKLLAFSRKQVLEPDVLDLNALVGDCENMFRRLLGENIFLTVNLATDLGKIKADPSQIDQVMLNLVINARDAMPRGGKLIISTANTILTEADRRPNEELIPGKYVSLSVSDTGCGMDDSTILHIFEPFFTTKDQGKGTGLGLAMVFGFIKQSGGHISVASELGKGSVFRIYLPELEDSFK